MLTEKAMHRNFNDMNETKLKELLKEAFEAGRDYQYTINPYSGKPNMFNDKPSFKKWYNAKLKLLGIGDVVNQRELLLDFANYSEIDKISQTTDECVDNYLDSIK